MFTISSLYLHYIFTVCSLYVHCMFTIHTRGTWSEFKLVTMKWKLIFNGNTCEIFRQYPFSNNEGTQASKGVWIRAICLLEHMHCLRECFPRNKGSEGNFICMSLIFRVKIFLNLVRFRVGEGGKGQ